MYAYKAWLNKQVMVMLKKKKVPLSAAGRDGMTGIRAGYKELQLILV